MALLAYQRAHNPRGKTNFVRPVDIATGYVPRDIGGAKIPLRDIPASERQMSAVRKRGAAAAHMVYDRLETVYGLGLQPLMTVNQKEMMWRIRLGIAPLRR